jgi:hypothetical protein
MSLQHPSDREVVERLQHAADQIVSEPALHKILDGAKARQTSKWRAHSRKRWLPVAGVVLAAGCLIVAAFVIVATGSSDQTDAPPATAGTSVSVDVYFTTEQDRLVSEQVTVEGTGDVGVDAVSALIYTQPTDPDHYNAWSTMAHEANDTADAGAQVLNVTHDDGVITVNLDSHVPEGPPVIDCDLPSDPCPAVSGRIMLQQLVYTVQAALDTADPVVLTDQGEPATMVSGTPIDGPIRADPKVLAPVQASNPSSGCQLPEQWAPAIEAGALSEQTACQELQPGEQQIPSAPPVMHMPGGHSLAIEGWVHEDSLEACRSGTYDSGDDAEALYCNAMLMIADGQLEPTHICEPSACGKLKLLWAYDEAQLRNLAAGN